MDYSGGVDVTIPIYEEVENVSSSRSVESQSTVFVQALATFVVATPVRRALATFRTAHGLLSSRVINSPRSGLCAEARRNFFASAALCFFWPITTFGQLEVVAQKETQAFFGGGPRQVAVTFHNPSGKQVETDLRIRVLQVSSVTAAPLELVSWKRLQVLGEQTITESARLTLPTVNAQTRFVLQWVESTNRIIGRTELLVYPPGLLGALKPLLGDEALGAWDPENQLKTLLEDVGVGVIDLEDSGLQDFHGRLAIIGPFRSKAQMPPGLASQIKRLAEKDVAIVWLLPPMRTQKEITPSFYQVREGPGTVVVVEAELASGLVESPQSQLNLIRFVELALHPEPNRLPRLSTEQ